jgi:hypothetical protein
MGGGKGGGGGGSNMGAGMAATMGPNDLGMGQDMPGPELNMNDPNSPDNIVNTQNDPGFTAPYAIGGGDQFPGPGGQGGQGGVSADLGGSQSGGQQTASGQGGSFSPDLSELSGIIQALQGGAQRGQTAGMQGGTQVAGPQWFTQQPQPTQTSQSMMSAAPPGGSSIEDYAKFLEQKNQNTMVPAQTGMQPQAQGVVPPTSPGEQPDLQQISLPPGPQQFTPAIDTSPTADIPSQFDRLFDPVPPVTQRSLYPSDQGVPGQTAPGEQWKRGFTGDPPLDQYRTAPDDYGPQAALLPRERPASAPPFPMPRERPSSAPPFPMPRERPDLSGGSGGGPYPDDATAGGSGGGPYVDDNGIPLPRAVPRRVPDWLRQSNPSSEIAYQRENLLPSGVPYTHDMPSWFDAPNTRVGPKPTDERQPTGKERTTTGRQPKEGEQPKRQRQTTDREQPKTERQPSPQEQPRTERKPTEEERPQLQPGYPYQDRRLPYPYPRNPLHAIINSIFGGRSGMQGMIGQVGGDYGLPRGLHWGAPERLDLQTGRWSPLQSLERQPQTRPQPSPEQVQRLRQAQQIRTQQVQAGRQRAATHPAEETYRPPIAPNSGGGSVREMQHGMRHFPISGVLHNQLQEAGKATGLDVEVISGGQPSTGPTSGPNAVRTPTPRHNEGRAADIQLRDTRTGQLLDMRKPEDKAKMAQFITESVRRGATGIGAGEGYMGGAHTIHVGGGTPMTWGAGGHSINAPAWLRAAYEQGQRHLIQASNQ